MGSTWPKAIKQRGRGSLAGKAGEVGAPSNPVPRWTAPSEEKIFLDRSQGEEDSKVKEYKTLGK